MIGIGLKTNVSHNFAQNSVLKQVFETELFSYAGFYEIELLKHLSVQRLKKHFQAHTYRNTLKKLGLIE